MRYILILLTLITLTSCGTYQLHSVRKQPEIKSVLAITSAGDTIQVSTDYLYREFRDTPGTYSNWRFYWDNSWYWGNGWYNLYDPYWRLRINRFAPYRVSPRIRVPQKVEVPQRYRPRTNTPQRVRSATPRGSNINRGRSNQPTRTPQYNRPTRTTPNVQQRPTQTRTNVGRTKNN